MDEDRTERVSASVEAQFHACRKEADAYLSTAKTSSGEFTEYRIDNFLKLVRMNAQLRGSSRAWMRKIAIQKRNKIALYPRRP